MKNILVPGGAGYIGSHTIVELIAAGYRPVIIDDFSNSKKQVLDRLKELTGQNITCYEHDFSDRDFLRDVMTKESIDGVIHFAAFKAVGESVENPLKYYHNNVAGLVTLLEVMEEAGVNDLVFSSSCVLYGDALKLPITEDEPIKPAASPYGTTKQMDETVIRDTSAASDTLRSLTLRYFNPIGAHPSSKIGELPLGIPSCLVPYITQTVAGIRQQLTVHGDDYPTPDGTCIRDYIHVVDLAKAHVKALAYLDKQKPGSYSYCNLGTGQGSSVLEVINTFEKVTGEKVPYKIGPRRAGDVITAYAAVDKAHDMLGWKTELMLGDALLDAWHWQESLKQTLDLSSS